MCLVIWIVTWPTGKPMWAHLIGWHQRLVQEICLVLIGFHYFIKLLVSGSGALGCIWITYFFWYHVFILSDWNVYCSIPKLVFIQWKAVHFDYSQYSLCIKLCLYILVTYWITVHKWKRKEMLSNSNNAYSEFLYLFVCFFLPTCPLFLLFLQFSWLNEPTFAPVLLVTEVELILRRVTHKRAYPNFSVKQPAVGHYWNILTLCTFTEVMQLGHINETYLTWYCTGAIISHSSKTWLKHFNTIIIPVLTWHSLKIWLDHFYTMYLC